MSKKTSGPTSGIISSFVETAQSRVVGPLKDLGPMLKITITIPSASAGSEGWPRMLRWRRTIARLINRKLFSVSFKSFSKSSKGRLS